MRASEVLSVDRVACGDNLVLLNELTDGCCDLIYIDPPFGSGQRRQLSNREGPAFRDPAAAGPQGMAAFQEMLRPRLVQMRRVLSPRGSLYVHLDWRTVHYIKVMLDGIFGPANFLNEIVWSYRTGGRSSRWFARKHDTILLYAREAGRHTFNLQRGGRFRTEGLNLDEHDRPYKSTRNGRLYFHPEGPALTDVWDLPFLSTVSNQRTGYPAQKPDALLERIVRASSNEGDLVADFFCGSGTALAAAKRLNRRYLGCDNNPEAVRISSERLESVGSDC